MRLILFLSLTLTGSPSAAAVCGTTAEGRHEALLFHRYHHRPGALDDANGGWERRGQVAVMADRGDLVARRNPFDLDGRGLRFTPSAGGYRTTPVAPPITAGEALALGGDDAAVAIPLGFAFPFFGRTYDQAFVHADGVVSFGSPEPSPQDRGLARFVSGPPAIAAFLANLDPSRGGTVRALRSSDRLLVTWEDIPGSGQQNRNTFSLALSPSGSIDLGYARIETREGAIGVTPGGTFDLVAADFSKETAAGPEALVELFSETERLDLIATVRRFLQETPDVYDQVVVYTTRPLNPVAGSLAFQINVRNAVEGIGLPLFDDGTLWGSPSALASVVYMDSIDTYLEVDGFEILAHEVGHRWLARLRFAGESGMPSTRLLGGGSVHWSFFFDSDGSFLGGNDIADLGGGRFETVDLVARYGPLDQYAMGLRGPAEVPVLFYVEEADNFRPNRNYRLSSGPEGGVRFTGRRVPLRIEDVVSAMGPRRPAAADSPRLLRQGYVLVHDAEAPATEARIAAVERIRSRFEGFYGGATDGRGLLDARLK